jgi:thioester reductase-like protein
MIGPCYSSGATNPNDFVARMLRGLAQMRAVPSFTESYVHMIPVDVCAKVVVAMGETLSSVGVALNYDGRSTTCSSNRKRLDFDTLVSGVERCLASSMDRLSYDKWCDLIHFNETNPLHSIWSRDSKSFPKFDRRIVYAKNTHKIVCDELGV